MKSILLLSLGVAGLVGCKGRTSVTNAIPTSDQALLDDAKRRAVPGALRSRLNLKVDSSQMAGSTAGALIVDRPGRGHIAVLGPIGPIFTVHTDGTGLSVINRPDRSHLLAPDADADIRAATEGLAGVNEVLGLLVGELPLEGLEITDRSRTPEG